MFISPAYAQAAGGSPDGLFAGGLVPLILIFVIFWFLVIRPQQKRMKEHRLMVEAVKRGDTVVTSGGIVGKVTRVQENELTIEIADGVKVQVVRPTISEVRAKSEPAKG